MSKLHSLQRKSSAAVHIVISLINSLKRTNEKIDIEKEANCKRIKNINTTQAELDKLKVNNSKIISNFESLLK